MPPAIATPDTGISDRGIPDKPSPDKAIPGAATVETLRHHIARVEAKGQDAAGDPSQNGRAQGAPARHCPVPLGLTALDETLGGGLNPAALHEIRATEADGSLAFGFALALLTRLAAFGMHSGRALVVTTIDGAGEWGRPYGPGLAGFGFDPGRLLLVEARRPREALWALEEGLSSRALGAVMAEIRGDPAVVDLTATRRLALRAARGGVPALLVRAGAGPGLSAARTRWRVTPLAGEPSIARPDDFLSAPLSLPFTLLPPAWAIDLERNGTRPGGTFTMMWKPDEHIFSEVPDARSDTVAGSTLAPLPFAGSTLPESTGPGQALPRLAVAPPADRAPADPEPGRQPVPLRRAG